MPTKPKYIPKIYKNISVKDATDSILTDELGAPSLNSGKKPVAYTDSNEIMVDGYVFSDDLGYATKANKVLSKYGYDNSTEQLQRPDDKMSNESFKMEIDALKEEQEIEKFGYMEGAMDELAKGGWIQKSTARMKKKGTVGSLTAAAKKAGYKSALAYARHIMSSPEGYSKKMKQKANWAINVNKQFGGDLPDYRILSSLQEGGDLDEVESKSGEGGGGKGWMTLAALATAGITAAAQAGWFKKKPKEQDFPYQQQSNQLGYYSHGNYYPYDDNLQTYPTKMLQGGGDINIDDYQFSEEASLGNEDYYDPNWTPETYKTNDFNWGTAIQALPALYNIGRGAFGKARRLSPGDYTITTGEPVPKVDITPQLQDIQAQTAMTKKSMRKSLPGMIAAQTAGDRMSASVWGTKYDIDRQNELRIAALRQRGEMFNVQTALGVEAENLRAEAMREAFISEGISGLGTVGAGYAREKFQREMLGEQTTLQRELQDRRDIMTGKYLETLKEVGGVGYKPEDIKELLKADEDIGMIGVGVPGAGADVSAVGKKPIEGETEIPTVKKVKVDTIAKKTIITPSGGKKIGAADYDFGDITFEEKSPQNLSNYAAYINTTLISKLENLTGEEGISKVFKKELKDLIEEIKTLSTETDILLKYPVIEDNLTKLRSKINKQIEAHKTLKSTHE